MKEHGSIPASFYNNESPAAILKQFRDQQIEYGKNQRNCAYPKDRAISSKSSCGSSKREADETVAIQSGKRQEIPETESAFLYDSAISQVKDCALKVVKSTLQNSSDTIASRLIRHNKVISQPMPEAHDLNNSTNVIYCNLDDIAFEELPALKCSRILKTFERIKRLGVNRPRSQSWAPIPSCDARDISYYSLVTEEVDDVSQEYIRAPKDFDDEYERKEKILEKDQNAINSAFAQASSKLKCAYLPHHSHVSQTDTGNFQLQNKQFDRLDDFSGQLISERISIISAGDEFNQFDRVYDSNLEIEVQNDQQDSQETCFQEPRAHNEKLSGEREYSDHWFYSPARQMRSDSISTNDEFSNRYTSANNNSEKSNFLKYSSPIGKQFEVTKYF